ncbi:hypothetical protein [Cohnella yongneupensis]|uniref:Uncharacterized protein n=1 Tax=Cohnella yongneupensis TaxID=425006 RepID=A0ABW0QWW4_9BACL
MITTCSLFSESGSYFSISYKVDLYIRKSLNEMIASKIKEFATQGLLINLIVSTNKKTVAVEVRGPDINIRDGFINWGLWLPYHEITSASEQIVPYLKCYFEAITQVFGYYNVSASDVRLVQQIVEKEIIGNSEYVYGEENTPEIDLSDLDLD